MSKLLSAMFLGFSIYAGVVYGQAEIVFEKKNNMEIKVSPYLYEQDILIDKRKIKEDGYYLKTSKRRSLTKNEYWMFTFQDNQKDYDEIERLIKVNKYQNKDVSGYAPIILAISQNNLQLSNILLENNANINAVDKDGNKAIHWAFKNNHLIYKLLQNIKGKQTIYEYINSQNKQNQTPLHFAILNEANHNTLEALINNGVNIEAVDKDGKTALYYAAIKGNWGNFKYLIVRGAKLSEDIEDVVLNKMPFKYYEEMKPYMNYMLIEILEKKYK